MGAPSWALEHINRVLKEHPDDTRAYVLAARAYDDLKRPGEARKNLATLLEIDPSNAIGLLVEARVRLREGNPGAARALLERVPDNARGHPLYLNTRGELETRDGNLESAVNFYRRAHEVTATAASATSVASALHRVARTEEAVGILEAFVAEHPDSIEANHTLGDLYLAQGRTNEATGAYKSVIGRDPGAVDALNNLAWILRSDSPNEAREYAEQAVALRPRDPRVIDTLGMVLLEAGDPRNAVKRLREAVSIAPEAGVLRFHLARALVAVGGREEAREHLRIALEGDSNFAQVNAARALLDAISEAP
jgi:tetratricopeptide (TPR) repeat protein